MLSWRLHYRGMILSEAYLDSEEALEERRAEWRHRLQHDMHDENMFCLLATLLHEGRTIVGFVCMFVREGYKQFVAAEYVNQERAESAEMVALLQRAAYIDNLHVHIDYQGRGIGGQLMYKASQAAHGRPLFLSVYALNTKAMDFYVRKMKGEVTTKYAIETKTNDGSVKDTFNVLWKNGL